MPSISNHLYSRYHAEYDIISDLADNHTSDLRKILAMETGIRVVMIPYEVASALLINIHCIAMGAIGLIAIAFTLGRNSELNNDFVLILKMEWNALVALPRHLALTITAPIGVCFPKVHAAAVSSFAAIQFDISNEETLASLYRDWIITDSIKERYANDSFTYYQGEEYLNSGALLEEINILYFNTLVHTRGNPSITHAIDRMHGTLSRGAKFAEQTLVAQAASATASFLDPWVPSSLSGPVLKTVMQAAAENGQNERALNRGSAIVSMASSTINRAAFQQAAAAIDIQDLASDVIASIRTLHADPDIYPANHYSINPLNVSLTRLLVNCKVNFKLKEARTESAALARQWAEEWNDEERDVYALFNRFSRFLKEEIINHDSFPVISTELEMSLEALTRVRYHSYMGRVSNLLV